jgi:hypothetical protein
MALFRTLSFKNYQFFQVFQPGAIRRHFYQVPDNVTYAVVRVNSNEKVNQVKIGLVYQRLVEIGAKQV